MDKRSVETKLIYPKILPELKVANRKDIYKYIWAFTLGDGSLHKDKRSPKGNARFSSGQLAIHEDYILWRASILQNITSVRITYTEYKTISRPNNKPLLVTQTAAHPKFTEIHNRMYHLTNKVLDPHHLKWLDWEVMSILYQDDGCLWFNKPRQTGQYRPNITLSTQSFSYSDNMLLSKHIYELLGINNDVQRRTHRSKISWFIEIKRADIAKFIQGVYPYIQPSFQYKVDLERMNISDYYKTVR